MSTRARLQNANDSESLWNYTLSPGWSKFDAHILRLAIMRYGCGAWRNISRHFPQKNCNQLNLQTQRLFGQQALAEFQKVHLDPSRLKVINDKIDGFRKNTCLINTGNNVSAEEKENRRNDHIEKYGIPKELYQRIQVPVVLDPPAPCETVIDDIEKLREMYRCVYDIQLRLKHLAANRGNNAAKIGNKNNNNTAKIAKKNKKKSDDGDVEMGDNENKNKNKQNDKSKDNDGDDGDIEIMEAPKQTEPVNVPLSEPMDDDVAMAMALSASMAAANIKTPAIQKTKPKKKSTKKKGSKKKKGSAKKKGSGKKKRSNKKRKKMESDGDDEYCPEPAKKRVKRK